MRRWLATPALLLVLSLTLSGCGEDTTLTTHAPGEYRGKSDSAAVMHPTDEQRSALAERFRAVQTDR